MTGRILRFSPIALVLAAAACGGGGGKPEKTAATPTGPLPAIVVDTPRPHEQVHSPLHLTGTSDTFEATFQYELKDASGKVIARHFVTATSGNGVRGTYDVSIPFTVTRSQQGMLSVYEDDAATGKRVHETDVPLTLAP
jgi:hypothetical protein